MTTPQTPIIGWLCSYTPVELLYGLNLRAYRLSGDGEAPIHASAYFHNMVCPYLRGCLDVGLRGGYDFLQGVIIANTCMVTGALYDYWRNGVKTPFVHFLEVPRNDSPLAQEYFAQNLKQACDALCAHFGIEYSPQALHQAIARQNRIREVLRELSALRQSHGAVFPSSALLRLIEESSGASQEQVLERLETVRDEVRSQPPGTGGRRPVLVTGMHQVTPQIVRLVEDAGLHVVYDDLCTGSHYYDEKDCELEGDPFLSLARTYLQQPKSARMMDQPGRHERLLRLVGGLKAEGVICYLNPHCCASSYDFSVLRRRLETASIPSLVLEGDYNADNEEQLKTRIQAFAELLEMRDGHA